MSITHNLGNATLHTLELGPMENLIYLLHDHATNQAAVIDPGWEAQQILSIIQDLSITLSDILLTHTHFDHVGAVNDLLKLTDARLHLLENEAHFWDKYLAFTKLDQHLDKANLHYNGDIINIGKTPVEVLHTPGHTPGSCCYLVSGHLLTGDTLFVMGCGRCDLPGGDFAQMQQTLRRLITELPKTTIVHPGHNYGGINSSIANQLIHNPVILDLL